MLGQKPMTWKATEQYLTTLMALLRGETVEIDGAPVKLIHPDGYTAGCPIPTPILVGANGPKGLAVAERLGAAGVVSIFGGQPGWDWCSLFAYGTVLDDGETLESPRVLDAAGPGAAVIYHGMYEAGPELLDGFPGGPEWRAEIEEIPERGAPPPHPRAALRRHDRTRPPCPRSVPHRRPPGPASRDELRQRLVDVEQSGVTEFMYAPMGSDIPRELEAFRSLVG